jgi:NAD(P)-dependent dehydrogenase (short-subunit alcohol dehydrogenase family)
VEVGAPDQLLDLMDTVAIVTGSGGGIGAGVARRLSAAGASLVLHTRKSPPPALDGKNIVVSSDLNDPAVPEQLIGAAVEAFGRVDSLVNNAGIQPVASLRDVSEDQFREMMETNVTAAHRLSQAAARQMALQGSGGSIVHITSIEGSQPAFLHGHYATAKAALRMHARALALELGPLGIRVNSVSPGLIDRPGLGDDWPEGVARWMASVPLGRLGTPDDVGDACVFLCSRLSRWITGIDLVVDGGVLTHPTW